MQRESTMLFSLKTPRIGAVIAVACIALLSDADADAAAASAELKAVGILHYAADSGDAAGAARLAEYYAMKSDDHDRRLFQQLQRRLQNDDWRTILADAATRTEAFGFSFALRPKRPLLAGLTVEIIAGLNPKTLTAKETLAAEYSRLFPRIKTFADAAETLRKIREDERRRLTLKKQALYLIKTYQGKLAMMSRENAAENFYQERHKQQQSKTQKDALAKMRNEYRMNVYKGREMLDKSYAFEPAEKRLKAFLATMKERIRKGEVTGEF